MSLPPQLAAPIDEQDAAKIVAYFADVTPPPETWAMEFDVDPRTGEPHRGSDFQYGNIMLNWGLFMAAIADGALTLVGAEHVSEHELAIIAVSAALLLWQALKAAGTEELTDVETYVFCTLWQNRDKETKTVPKAGLLQEVNKMRTKYGHAPFSQKEVDNALSHLQDVKTIRESRNDSSRWWIREWVHVKYR